jgi:thioredoxin 1
MSYARGQLFQPHDYESFAQWLHRNAVEEGRLCLVDYSATWCGPCKKAKPAFEQLAAQYPDVAFASVEVDRWENDGQIESGSVRAFPTFHFVRGEGKPLFETVGYNEALLRQKLQQLSSY